MAVGTSCLSRDLLTSVASTSTATPTCQGLLERSHHLMNPQNRLANPAPTYSTTSSDPSLGARTVIGVGATEEEKPEHANDDADADADSEAESDTSQCFDSGSEDIEGPEDDDDGQDYGLWDGAQLDMYGWGGNDDTAKGGYTMDDENDTNMTNTEPPSSPVFAQASASPAITNLKKKARRCKLSRKHYGNHGLSGSQRTMTSPAILAYSMDVDLDAAAQEESGDDSDSSADEDTDGYVYSSWFGGIYHPMWLAHALASGKKRRDNGREEEGEDRSVEIAPVAEGQKRRIKLPSVSRRKRAWKASQGTPSSVGESEWSLTVNYPMPQSSGNNSARVIASPPMTPPPITTPKQMHTAPRSTLSRQRQNPARALERRLENLRVEDLGHRSSTAVSTSSTAATANDLRPRLLLDQHEKKRPRYQGVLDAGSVGTTAEDVISPPIIWGVASDEPMDFTSSGVDGQWDTQGFGMAGIEVGMSSAGVSGSRAQDITRVLEGVDELL